MENYKEKFTLYMDTVMPLIDAEISAYYHEKKTNAHYDFIRELYPLVEEYCLRDGKRIRPLLVVLAYDGYSLLKNKRNRVIKLSSFLEIMHSMFLVQDDIIDKSQLRRGKKALHIICAEKFSLINKNPTIGDDVAGILADVMFTNSIEFIACSGFSGRIIRELLSLYSRNYEMTAWGQILDSLYSNATEVPLEKNIPLTVSTLKTAYYTIYFPLVLGYTLSGKKDEQEKKRIENFALPLGLAFQIRDDILGTFGSAKDTGKPDDTDIHEGKFTLLVQYALEAMKVSEQKLFIKRLTKQKKTEKDIKYIRNAIEKSGAYELTVEKHRTFIAQSSEILETLSIKKNQKQILRGLISKIANIE